MDKLMEASNLKFIASGVLTVEDPLFITRWHQSEEFFKSDTSYSSLDDESFILRFCDDSIPDHWNQFGIEQRFESKNYLSAPFHRNRHLELHYIEKGSFTLKINHQMIHLEAGDVLILNDQCYHSDLFDPNSSEMKLYILGINQEAFSCGIESIRELPIFQDFLDAKEKKSQYLLIHNVKNLEDKLEALRKNIKQLSEEGLVTFLKNLFKHPFHLYEESAKDRNIILFEALSDYIDAYYYKVDLKELSEYFNFSLDHISRIIKKESGLSFNQYLQKVRIDKAKELLITSDLSVKVIIHKVGYKNQNYFYQIFKKQTGLTPHQYRLEKKTRK